MPRVAYSVAVKGSHSVTPAPEPASEQAISDSGVSMRITRLTLCSAKTRSMRKRDTDEWPSEMKLSPSKSVGRSRFLRASRWACGSTARCRATSIDGVGATKCG